jgi:phosphoribosylformimino-5-aminoimidazole carboxamide ribotide isomerase
MILLPAVDIRGGKAVRLLRGDFDQETVYADSPLEAARAWAEQGARSLHVVDLDGAREGEPRSLEHLRAITKELDVPVQYGGGLRSVAAVRSALAAGADRVVLGTAAFTDMDFLDEVVHSWGSRVVVAVDVRGGNVSVAGWTQATQMRAADVIARLQDRGVRQFIYTNVDRDGTMEGPDPDEVRRIGEAIRGRFAWSGGIGSLDHLRTLRETRLVNLAGVIAGKALYEQRFGVAEANDVLAAEA